MPHIPWGENNDSFVESHRRCVLDPPLELWNGRNRPTMTLSTFGPFLSAINTDLIYNISGVQSCMRKMKRASFVQEYRHCVGATKTHLRNGHSRPTDTDGHSLSAISTKRAVFYFKLDCITEILAEGGRQGVLESNHHVRAVLSLLSCCACDCVLFCRAFFAVWACAATASPDLSAYTPGDLSARVYSRWPKRARTNLE
jgi:hypothetical protein